MMENMDVREHPYERLSPRSEWKINCMCGLLVLILGTQIFFAASAVIIYRSDTVQKTINLISKIDQELFGDIKNITEILSYELATVNRLNIIVNYFMINMGKFDQLLAFSSQIEKCLQSQNFCKGGLNE